MSEQLLNCLLQAAVACAAVALVEAHLHPLHTYTRWVEVRKGRPAHACSTIHANSPPSAYTHAWQWQTAAAGMNG